MESPWNTNRNFRRRVVYFVVIFSVALIFLFSPGTIETSKETQTMTRMIGPLPYDDPDLLEVVRNRLLHPPSDLPYDLVGDRENQSTDAKSYLQYKGEFGYMFYAKVIKELFEGVRKGFFVEAGAIDGEFLSNTLLLETKQGWTGLLVEADGNSFKELLKKHRKSWTIHACLAAHEYPHQDVLVKFRPEARGSDSFNSRAASAHGMMLGQDDGVAKDKSNPGHREYELTSCLPLATPLLAIGIIHVDLVSLDVEGMEPSILRHFPWNQITVDVWLIEHATPTTSGDAGKAKGVEEDFIKTFTDRGYVLFDVNDDMSVPNYVFILGDSDVYKRVKGKEKRIISNTKVAV